MPGVSIVICCHNSRARLCETLGHLARQIVPAGLPWEVIVVDNGSTDDTATVAEKLWSASSTSALLRVVGEPKLGLSFARARGLSEARHDFISLVDDDNWVGPNWVRLVSEIMTAQPRVGACGGISEAAFETPPPSWFAQFSRSFAVGELSSEAADVTWSKGYLWGAGLSIRKQAWQKLHADGFTPLLQDRSGSSLSSGGDTELCRALRLAGWRLHYDPRLRLQHFMPAGRLTWDYLRRLRRAFGVSSVAIEAYDLALRSDGSPLRRLARESWALQFFWTLKDLLGCGAMAWSERRRKVEGDATALKAEWLLSRLNELVCHPLSCGRMIGSIRKAAWRDAEVCSPAKPLPTSSAPVLA
jgi:cellulose synthase/poly-beta-1,6-N-acetylglucosamine synthase-like glycosyltransferase